MKISINDDMLTEMILGELKKSIGTKVREAFSRPDRWSSEGGGLRAIEKILREYLRTIEFKTIVEEEIKKIMRPEIESIARGYLAKETKIIIKQILAEQKV